MIILASKSPRRKNILSRLDLPFNIITPGYVEEEYDNLISPSEYASGLARNKALSVTCTSNDLIIGADTIVVINDEVLGKPKNDKEAKTHLNKLSGNTHQVITGVSIQLKKLTIDYTFHVLTHVTFHDLDDNDITHYVLSKNPLDKAGSYGIQDYSSIFVEKIDGCYDNVVGFPLSQFYLEIKKLGVNLDEFKL